MKYFIPLYLVILLAACGGATDSHLSKEKIYQLYDSGKYLEAMDVVNVLIAKYHDSAGLYSLRGDIRAMLNEKEDSVLIDFQRAITLSPTDYFYYLQRARYLSANKQEQKSLADFDKAIAYADSDSIRNRILGQRAAAQVSIRLFEGAVKDYQTILENDSTNIEGVINIAAVFMAMERKDEALEYLLYGSRLYPNEKMIIGNIGFWYLGAKQYDKAVVQFNKALELDENDALAYNNRGYARLQLKDVEGALRDVDHSIQLKPDNSYAYRNRALVYIAMKRREEACADLVKAMDLGFNERYGTEVQQLIVKNCPDD